MLDEVQTGIGRTGRLFAFQHAGIQPDVMTLAKGLGNGVPIGACLARGAAAEVFTPGSHGSTFGGNPLVCRVGRAVLETLIEGNLIANAEVQGAYLLDSLRAALAKTRGVVEIRGRGLMVGIELDRPCGALVGRALDAGLLINVTAERVIRLLPPLIIDRAQVEELVATLTGLIHGFLGDA
jgi:acetylornithine aminotransferase (EC 2.6.1.11)